MSLDDLLILFMKSGPFSSRSRREENLEVREGWMSLFHCRLTSEANYLCSEKKTIFAEEQEHETYNGLIGVHLRIIRTKNKHGTLAYDWHVSVNVASPYNTPRIL